MKFLLLALFVGVACATLENENTGAWNTYAVAADHEDKVAENGPLRGFLRTIACDNPECSSVSLTFWMKNNGECQSFSIVGVQVNDSNVYNTDFAGQNNFEFSFQSKDMLVISVKNTDENGVVTKIVEVAVRPGHKLTRRERKVYKRLVEKQGIPDENIMYIIKEDTCPK